MATLLFAAILVEVIAAQGKRAFTEAERTYLTWSAAQAEAIGASGYKRGRIGGVFDGRLLKTERAYKHKLAATMFSPEVIRATARLHQ